MTKTVCTNPELLDKEVKHLREAMGKCKFPAWAINKVQSKVLNNWGENGNTNNNQAQPTNGQESSSTHTTATRSN